MTRRDRDGSEIETPDDTNATPSHYCDGGWIGHDEVGRPKHCPICRPWIDTARLAHRRRLHGGAQ